MADYKVIFTNHALSKMKAWGLSEDYVLDALQHGETENANFGGKWNTIRKYPSYEIGVNFDRNDSGQTVIVSVWKRCNRR